MCIWSVKLEEFTHHIYLCKKKKKMTSYYIIPTSYHSKQERHVLMEFDRRIKESMKILIEN